MKLKALLSAALAMIAVHCVSAEKITFKFHQLFTTNAVFQQNTEKHPFKGYAPAGSKVDIQFRENTASTTANEKGEWCVTLPTGSAGTGFELKATCGGKTITATNIAVGEVWLVSGQSNAEFTVKFFKDGAEWAKDADYPQIRFQTQSWQPPHMRKDDTWKVLNEKTALQFSATGFFFAKELFKKKNVPVGIIVSAAGGSVINKWIPTDALEQITHAKKNLIDSLQNARKAYPEKLKKYEEEMARRKNLSAEEVKKLPKLHKPFPPFPLYSELFNQRVKRLEGLPIRGVIWYQGEADAMFAGGYIYREYLEALITSYRKHFGNDVLPFLIVEIPYYGNNHIWSDLRDSQKFVTDKMDHVQLVSILDLGDLKDIHPPRKAELGARLMLTAEKFVYGGDLVATGPVYESMQIEGSRIILRFKADSIGGGLCSSDGAPLRGFTIADEKGRFYPADAAIEGDTVIVSSPKVKNPAAVRYGWAPSKDGPVNFFNKAGFPSGLFRTDNFRLPTERR